MDSVLDIVLVTYFYHAEIYLGGSGEITSKKNVELYKSHMFVSGGLTINTDQDFVNTASFITLVDDLVIVAKRDVHMETTVHYEKIKEHGHHSKTTGKIPVFEMAGAESKNGSIKITAVFIVKPPDTNI